MRIALVRQRYVEHGGAERYMNAVAAELVRRGHEVHVFANRWDDAAASRGVVFHRVPMIHVTSFLRVLSFAINSKKMITRFPTDVVFSFERTLRQDIYRAGDGCHREYLRQRLRHSPPWKRITIWFNPLHATLLWLERRVFDPANTRHIIANSARGKDEIVRHYGFPAERITVVYNGVDTERFKPTARPGTGTLLFVGSGWERKGLEFAIRALPNLPEHVTLRVVGKGNRRRYERLARQLGVAGRVNFAPPLSQIEEAYAKADVFLFPTIYEPFANVCLEALACGLPVVTSRINGASEIITPGVNGAVLEEPADTTELATGIGLFLDPGRWAEASVRARETAESLPFSRCVEGILEVIRLAGQQV